MHQADKARKTEREREQLTLCRAARAHHEREVKPNLTIKHSAQRIASLEHYVPAGLWHLPIASITAPTLLKGLPTVRALDDLSERVPETLQRVHQRLDVVFEDAIFHGHCLSNPARALRAKLARAMPRQKAPR